MVGLKLQKRQVVLSVHVLLITCAPAAALLAKPPFGWNGCSGDFPLVCNFSRQNEYRTRRQPKYISAQRVRRVAILTTGIVERFYPKYTLQRVAKPLAYQGYVVDYLAFLAYTDRNLSHIFSAYWLDPYPNPETANSFVAGMLVPLARVANVSLLKLFVGTNAAPPPELAVANFAKNFFGRDSGSARPFQHTISRLMKIEMLWNWTASSGEKYDYYIWVRPDLYWYDDFRMSDFPSSNAVYAGTAYRDFHFRYASRRVCDPRINASKLFPSDLSFVVGSNVADRFFRLFRTYWKLKDTHTGRVEEFFKQAALSSSVSWKQVSMWKFPHCRIMHQWDFSNNSRPTMCLRTTRPVRVCRPDISFEHPECSVLT